MVICSITYIAIGIDVAAPRYHNILRSHPGKRLKKGCQAVYGILRPPNLINISKGQKVHHQHQCTRQSRCALQHSDINTAWAASHATYTKRKNPRSRDRDSHAPHAATTDECSLILRLGAHTQVLGPVCGHCSQGRPQNGAIPSFATTANNELQPWGQDAAVSSGPYSFRAVLTCSLDSGIFMALSQRSWLGLRPSTARGSRRHPFPQQYPVGLAARAAGLATYICKAWRQPWMADGFACPSDYRARDPYTSPSTGGLRS